MAGPAEYSNQVPLTYHRAKPNTKQLLLHRWNARLQLYISWMYGDYTGDFLL